MKKHILLIISASFLSACAIAQVGKTPTISDLNLIRQNLTAEQNARINQLNNVYTKGQAALKIKTLADSAAVNAKAASLPISSTITINGTAVPLNGGSATIAAGKTQDQIDSAARKNITDSLNNLYVDPAQLKAALNTSRSISAPTTIAPTDNIIVITSGTFTQSLPTGLYLKAYNIGSGVIIFTLNGATIKQLNPGTIKSPDFIQFTWNSTLNTYLTN